MGTFVKLINFDKLNRYRTGSGGSWVEINGTSRDFQSAESNTKNIWTYAAPFYVNSVGTLQSSPSTGFQVPFPYASSNSEIPYNQTSIPNQVGNCSVAYTRNSNNTGWIANITIVAASDSTVKSILFVSSVNIGYTGQAGKMLTHAYILDNPIELNAQNNYTATLTIAIEF